MPDAGNLLRFELKGPGKIIGVGNGDPSCHEPDVYIDQPSVRTLELNDWRLQIVPDVKERPETAESFADQAWRKVDVRAEYGPLNPGESAVFRTHLNVKPEDLSASNIQVTFGMIDDDGWVYVNGQFAGDAHDWSTSHTFDIRKFLHLGENTLAVAVKNNAAQGGLNKGITLEIPQPPILSQWKRSVFNGLAQILVQSSKEAGELKLTARADGLQPATLAVTSQACTPRPAVP